MAAVRASSLNLSHKRGGAKARFLLSVGYRSDHPLWLESDLRTQHLSRDVARTSENPYGVVHILRDTLRGNPAVRDHGHVRPCDAGAPQQILKARVPAQRIPLRLHLQAADPRATFGVDLLQPCQRAFGVTEADVGRGHGIRSDVRLFGWADICSLS